MTRHKVTLIIDGNEVAIHQLIHKLHKIKSEANTQPELEVSLQSEPLESTDFDTSFDSPT